MLILISERTAIFKELAVRLNENGIFLYLCSYGAAPFYCDKKDTGGVLLDCEPDLAQGEALCYRLRALYPEMPIGAIVPENSIPDMPATRIIRSNKGTLSLSEILDFCITNCGWRSAKLSTYALTVCNDPEKTLYMGYYMPLPPRQHTILRCLFYRTPALTPADDLMELCYPEGTQSITNLAVQIRNINISAAKIDPRPLIVNIYQKGYRLRDGI